VILALWAIALFSGLGLFAQSNGLVIAALTFGAICIAFAMFLILELGPPTPACSAVSPAALQEAIANINQ
jgi:hypothetical protein